jgi:hypothetical protein
VAINGAYLFGNESCREKAQKAQGMGIGFRAF